MSCSGGLGLTERSRKYRSQQFREQSGRCYYCGFPMWERRCQKFAALHGISLKDAARFKSTAEHMLAQADGGTSRRDNIVATCQFCNQNRHHCKKPQSAIRYRQRVQRQVARRSWHPQHLFKMIDQPPPVVKPPESLGMPRVLVTSLDEIARRHVEGFAPPPSPCR